MKSCRVVLYALLLTLPASWASAQPTPAPIAPTDFAWHWSVDAADSDGVVRFTLTPEVYARITRPDLADLAAFNANDEAVPLGPAALAFERLVLPPVPAPVDVPIFRVPRAAAAGGDRVELHIARGSDGRLTRLDAEVAPDASGVASDVLIDVSSVDQPVTGLQLSLAELPPEGLNARIDIHSSDDLSDWQPLASGLALVSLREGGLSLERTALELPATQRPYLRLRRSDAEAALPLQAVKALPARRGSGEDMQVIPALASLAVAGSLVADAPGAFEYSVAGPFPIERIAIALADANSVAGFVLESRAHAQAAWTERAQGTAFRLGNAASATQSAPWGIATTRDRHWRLRSTPALARAPKLEFSYRPESFVLLTQGDPPYRLVAGSVRARAPQYPLRTVLAAMRAEHGDLWLPPEAKLGAGSPLAGDAALSAPPPPPPYRQWLLWGVLIAAALGVIVMVLKLVRSPPE